MVCRAADSLGLSFQSSGHNAVVAACQARTQWQGYAGVLHGGMISTLLDAAMTHCLFRQGIEAMTASLKIRFHEPVPCNARLEIRASLEKRRRHVYFLNAEILSFGRLYARAEASFMRRGICATNGAVADTPPSARPLTVWA